MIISETVSFEFNTHAKEFVDKAKVFDFKGLDAGEEAVPKAPSLLQASKVALLLENRP